MDYFELTSYEKVEEILHLYLKEINSIPKEYKDSKLSSKGFFEEITVQDFPRVTQEFASFLKEINRFQTK